MPTLFHRLLAGQRQRASVDGPEIPDYQWNPVDDYDESRNDKDPCQDPDSAVLASCFDLHVGLVLMVVY
jgi:hypothetical protein